MSQTSPSTSGHLPTLLAVCLVAVSVGSILGFAYIAVNPRIIYFTVTEQQTQVMSYTSYSSVTNYQTQTVVSYQTISITAQNPYGGYPYGCYTYGCSSGNNAVSLYGYLAGYQGSCVYFQSNNQQYSLYNLPSYYPTTGYVYVRGYVGNGYYQSNPHYYCSGIPLQVVSITQ